MKSLDVKSVSILKKKLKNKNCFNNTIAYHNMTSMFNDVLKERGIKENKNDIKLLENANLKIIKTLSSMAKEELSNITKEFKSNKNNNIINMKSSSNLNKLKDLSLSPQKKVVKFSNKNISAISAKSIKSILKPNKTKINKKSSKKVYKQRKTFTENKNNFKLQSFKNSSGVKSQVAPKHKRNTFTNVKNKNKLNLLPEVANNNMKNISNKQIVMNFGFKRGINFEEFFNKVEIMKINNNLRKSIKFINLRKSITKLKQNYNSRKSLFNKSISKKFNISENKNSTLKDKNSELNSEIKLIQKNKKDESIDNIPNDNIKVRQLDKYRILNRKKELYDSLDDEEIKEVVYGFYLSPDSWYIRFFDFSFLIISVSYSFIVPFLLSNNYFIKHDNSSLNHYLIIIDIFYMLDCLINFFKAYKKYDEHLVMRKRKIICHYFKTWFVADFLQAIPFYTIFMFNIFSFDLFLNNKFPIILLLKIIKTYKMFYYNSTMKYLSEILSSIELVDNYGSFILIVFIMVIILNMVTCVFIFLGNINYFGWLIKISIQDEDYSFKYLTSLYFILVTITTVGYGDITGNTYSEILFQIFLLIIGTIAYSFLVSYISNQIVKMNKKSMTFEKNLEIIQEIKLHHPHMKNSLYNEVIRNLHNMELYERKDKHILLDSLPDSLKNTLIISMYQQLISNFNFFKNIDNSDFIVKVITSLVPIISIRNDIIIQEGDYITEIFFVKRGVISLNISFNLNNIGLSLNKYFYRNQIGKFNVLYLKTYNHSTHYINSSSDSSVSDKSDNIDTNDIVDIKIVEIRHNEHFGDALMFLNERSPMIAKVKTNNAELLLLKKLEAIEIYSLYPNIWKRINKTSLNNMELIYQKIKKSIIKFAKFNNINLEEFQTKNKSEFGKINNGVTFINQNKKATIDKIKKKIASNSKSKTKSSISIVENNSEIKKHNKKESKNESKKDIKKEIKIDKDKKDKDNEDIKDIEDKNKRDKNKNKIDKDNEKDKNLIKIVNINNIENIKSRSSIINIMPSNNIQFNLFQINKPNFELKENIKKIEHIPYDIYMSKIKQYFNSSSKIIKLKEIKTETNINSDTKRNKSLSPCKSNDLEVSFNLNSSLIKTDNLLYHNFTNLVYTNEQNLTINSSYENINKLSNDRYIKNKKLQLKIKEILVSEINDTINGTSTFSKLPDTCMNTIKKFEINNTDKEQFTQQNFENLSFSRDINNNKSEQSNSSINNSNNKESNSSTFDLIKRFNSGKILITDNSINNINNNKIIGSKTPIHSIKKVPKKKTVKIKKQLNIITKNVENTNKNINNPEEFYSKLFKNIIVKETQIMAPPTALKKLNLEDEPKKDNKKNDSNNKSLFNFYMKGYKNVNKKSNENLYQRNNSK